MNFGINENPAKSANDCLVIGIVSDGDLPAFIKQLDPSYQELITRLRTKLFESGDVLWQTEINDHSLLLIHCGELENYTTAALIKHCKETADILIKQRIRHATICMPPVKNLPANRQIHSMLLAFSSQSYQLLEYKTRQKKPHQLSHIDFYLPGADEQAVYDAQAVSAGIEFTRTLANLPANICTPAYLAAQAMELDTQYDNIHTTILEKNDLQELGMGALLAVAKGSSEPPKLVELQYKGGGDTPPVVLVGKGITFDSGGLSIKPADAMTEMKYDMAGAASVLGTLKACAELKMPINVTGLIACAENMPSGTAVKPGDVVTSLSGQTIEILNTDAEGRLVLADALTYAERYNPALVLDIATLTGAVIVALGKVYTGFMTKDDELAKLIESAALQSEDKTWRLPLDDEYNEAMCSPIADMINASFDRSAGSITAASFLSRFTGNYRWAHLDIAGTSWVSGKMRNATGRPVPLLVELLRHVAAR